MLINPFTVRALTSRGAKSKVATAVPSARVELAVLVACSFVDVVEFRKAGLAKKEEDQCKRARTTFSAVNRV